MSVPKAVQEQERMAEEMQRDFAQGKTAPAAPAAPAAPPPPIPAPKDAGELAVANQRYAVLQGKYNAEVPKLHDRIKELEAQISGAKGAPATAGEVMAGLDESIKALSDEFGEEFAQRIVSIAKTLVAQEIAPLREVSQQTVQERFYANLTAAVPDWQTLAGEPGWAEYLNQTDPSTGITRYPGAKAAMDSFQAEPLVSMFRGYRAAKAARSGANSRLDHLVHPESSSAPHGIPETEDGGVRADDITAFYDAVKLNRLTPEQIKAGEARINKAIAERKVIP